MSQGGDQFAALEVQEEEFNIPTRASEQEPEHYEKRQSEYIVPPVAPVEEEEEVNEEVIMSLGGD